MFIRFFFWKFFAYLNGGLLYFESLRFLLLFPLVCLSINVKVTWDFPCTDTVRQRSSQLAVRSSVLGFYFMYIAPSAHQFRDSRQIDNDKMPRCFLFFYFHVHNSHKLQSSIKKQQQHCRQLSHSITMRQSL
jgi:hypothetical protein